jgi:acetyl esterase/lipase
MASREIEDFLRSCRRMPSQPPTDLVAAVAFANARSLEEYPAHPSVRIEPALCRDVDAVWYRPPEAEPEAVILYIHGGGFMWSSAMAHGGLISRIALAAGVDTLALDYGLAPANLFPGPVQEAVRLYRWLLARGYDPAQIAFVGDSAGGGLVLATLHALKAQGTPYPACAAISSAYLDLTHSGESLDWVIDDPCVHRAGLEVCRDIYLQGSDPRDPLASPLFGELAGYPPLLVQAGSREQLMSDSTRLAAKASAAGVKVRLEVYDGCVHLWHWWVPDAPESKAALKSIATFVRANLGVR